MEENIILGPHIHIKTLPILDIHSNDVQASHGAKIQ
ncbi:MAG: SufD family Fe-S cluster assembly protein [bacterium]|nr:SufD family Fe-S cluster assembly protein [bacterium]